MCGIAGYTNVTDPLQRWLLTVALGAGIDTRGGDAVGFVTVAPDGAINHGRTLKTWAQARGRFVRAAAAQPTALLHARFATVANADDVNCAHPFAVRRPRGPDNVPRTVLWGAHNGCVSNAHASAKRNGRTLSVDSLELFELLADRDHAAINALHGWGVISYIESDDRQAIRLCTMSDGAALVVARTETYAIVYASTEAILDEALTYAGFQAWDVIYRGEDMGRTYVAHGATFGLADGVPEMRFAPRAPARDGWRGRIKYLGASSNRGSLFDAANDDPWGDIDDLDEEDVATLFGVPVADVRRERWIRRAASAPLVGETDDADDWWRDLEGEGFDRRAFEEWCAKEGRGLTHE